MAGSEFVEGWIMGETLGEGAYGEVKLVVNSTTGDLVAMKIIDLRKHSDAALLVRKETAIQRNLRHPNLLKYFGKRSHGHCEYIFLEYCSGGELFDKIEPDVGMPVKDAKRYFVQILSGVEYLHAKGIAHRDLKPENLLLDQHDNLKISDFGMATMFRLKGIERKLERRCGTLPYVAPEVLAGPYSAPPADLWSCGIILIAMLVGELPWDQPTSKCKEYEEWSVGSVAGVGGPWRCMDAAVLGLLRRLLSPEPQRRPPLTHLQAHPWLRDQSCDNKVMSGLHDLEVSLSQPLPTGDCTASLLDQKNLLKDDQLCFSQPVMNDDMLLSSQANATQSSQEMFQRFVKRMTRFFVTGDADKVMDKLSALLRSMQCQMKISHGRVVTITTVDSRKMQLVFKANFLDMDGKLLLDFRLSKGCGLEFKRRFLNIKRGLKEIIIN